MKKIAIVLSKIGPRKQTFIDYLTQELSGIAEVVGVRTDDLGIFVGDKTKVSHFGESLEKFDLVFFRRIGNKNLSIANIISDYLTKRGVDFIDRALGVEGRGEDKLTNNYILSESGISVIPTVFSSNWQEIVTFVGTPLIAKDIDKQRNEGVYTIKNKDDFDKLRTENPDSRFIYQKFMEIDKEYRLLVMGDHVGTILQKDPRIYDFKVLPPADPVEVYLEGSAVSDEHKQIAVDASKALGLQVAGVDLMIEKGTGKPYIVEVNRGPGITIETDKSPEMPALANYLKQKLTNDR